MNLTILAILLGFGLVFTQSAFKATPKSTTYWVFDGTSINDALDASLYHEDSSAPSCAVGTSLPCKIEMPAEVNTEGLFQDYLDNTYVNPSDVLSGANVSKRD